MLAGISDCASGYDTGEGGRRVKRKNGVRGSESKKRDGEGGSERK